MEGTRTGEASPPTMLSSYNQYPSTTYMGPHEPQDVKPYSQTRMPPGPSSYLAHQHASPLYQPVNVHHENLVYVLPSDSKDSTSNDQIPKSAGSRWREEETMTLVEIWRDKIYQTRWWKQNKCVRVNKEMWDEIATVLMEKGIYRTASQCQIRMKNLLQYFRQMVDHKRSEKSREELPDYFEIVHNIMNGRGEGEAGGRKRMYTDDDETEDTDMDIINDKKMNGEVSLPRKERVFSEKTCDGRPRKMSTASTSSNSAEPRRAASASPRIIHRLQSRSEEMPNVHVSSTASMHHSSVPYPQHAMIVPRHCNGQVHESNSIVHNPIPQRFVFPTTGCLPPPNASQPQAPLVGSYPDASMRSMSQCNATGCCREPAIKRQCLDSSCYLNHYNGAPNFPEAHRFCRTKIPGFPKHENEVQPPSNAGSSPNLGTRDSISQQPYGLQNYDGESDNNNNIRSGPSDQECPSEWLQTVKECLLTQQKQLQTLLEIEQSRLQLEERKMKMQEDSDSRNGAFLMEAVRILAEAFNKNGHTRSSSDNQTICK